MATAIKPNDTGHAGPLHTDTPGWHVMGVVLRVHPDRANAIASMVTGMNTVTIVDRNPHTIAAVLESPNTGQLLAALDRLSGIEGVTSVLPTFHGTDSSTCDAEEIS